MSDSKGSEAYYEPWNQGVRSNIRYVHLAVTLSAARQLKDLSYSYFSVFGILIFFYMFFLYTRTFQKSKIQMGEAPGADPGGPPNQQK